MYHTYGSTRAILSINKVTMSNSVIHFDGMLYSVIHVTIYNGVVQILSLVHVCFLFFVNGIVINKVISFLVSIISPFFICEHYIHDIADYSVLGVLIVHVVEGHSSVTYNC